MENVHFYQLHHKSELPQDCFPSSLSMIWYIVCLANFFGSIATSIYVISMEDAKLKNLIIEPVFYFACCNQ